MAHHLLIALANAEKTLDDQLVAETTLQQRLLKNKSTLKYFAKEYENHLAVVNEATLPNIPPESGKSTNKGELGKGADDSGLSTENNSDTISSASIDPSNKLDHILELARKTRQMTVNKTQSLGNALLEQDKGSSKKNGANASLAAKHNGHRTIMSNNTQSQSQAASNISSNMPVNSSSSTSRSSMKPPSVTMPMAGQEEIESIKINPLDSLKQQLDLFNKHRFLPKVILTKTNVKLLQNQHKILQTNTKIQYSYSMCPITHHQLQYMTTYLSCHLQNTLFNTKFFNTTDEISEENLQQQLILLQNFSEKISKILQNVKNSLQNLVSKQRIDSTNAAAFIKYFLQIKLLQNSFEILLKKQIKNLQNLKNSKNLKSKNFLYLIKLSSISLYYYDFNKLPINLWKNLTLKIIKNEKIFLQNLDFILIERNLFLFFIKNFPKNLRNFIKLKIKNNVKSENYVKINNNNLNLTNLNWKILLQVTRIMLFSLNGKSGKDVFFLDKQEIGI